MTLRETDTDRDRDREREVTSYVISVDAVVCGLRGFSDRRWLAGFDPECKTIG